MIEVDLVEVDLVKEDPVEVVPIEVGRQSWSTPDLKVDHKSWLYFKFCTLVS